MQRVRDNLVGFDLALFLILGGFGLLWMAFVLTGWFDGIFTSDELIYSMAIDAFQRNGSLTIENGYQTYGSDNLRLWFLIAGPNGLVPQYPSGFTILAAPFYALAGLRGVMILNVLAAVATLYACHQLAFRLFGDRRLARTAVFILAAATFLVDYAMGIWPHALSALAVVAATWAAAGALNAEPRAALRAGLLSGGALGAGLLIRVDVMFAAPAIAVWMVLFAPRLAHAIGGMAIGAVPGFAASAILNFVKFGSASPVSYGQTGGWTDPAAYLVMAPAALIVLGVCLWLRNPEWRGRLWVPALLSGIVLVLSLWLVPDLRSAVVRFVRGAYVLLFDLGATTQVGVPGIERDADGIVWFYGLAKKALAQSLPWLAILPVLGPALFRSENRAGLSLCLIVCAVWVFPFAWFEWHGGIANNLRYFLPMAPLLAVLAAAALWQVSRIRMPEIRWRIGLSLLVLIALAIGIFLFAGGNWIASVQRNVPLLVGAFLLLASTVFAAAPAARPLAGQAVRSLFWAAFAMAFVSAYVFDLSANHGRRAYANDLEVKVRVAPADSLVVAYIVESFLFQVLRKDGLLAFSGRLDHKIDTGLIRAALADGRRVFIQGKVLTAIALATDASLAQVQSAEPLGNLDLREIVRAGTVGSR